MGFFSGFCSFVSNTVSSAVRTMTDVATKALNYLADRGEDLIQTVKDVWKKTKPYLENVQVVSKAVKKIPGMPEWVIVAAEVIDRGLAALFALENSPILKKVEDGIRWAIAIARVLRDTFLSKEELKEAEERKQAFAQAAGSLNDEQKRAVLFAQIVNELLMVRTKLQEQIDGSSVASFHYYLRLHATQKLLSDVNRRINEHAELDAITADDLFLLEVGHELLAEDPDLTDAQLERLNSLVRTRFGKELVPFVLVELVRGWAMVLNGDQKRYDEERDKLAKDEALRQGLESQLALDLLSQEENSRLAELQQTFPLRQEAVKKLFDSIRQRQHFIDASEGLLQAVEGKLSGVEAELIPEVGKIIINCMQKGQRWEQLVEEDRELVIDFANVFREARIRRGEELEREINTLVLVEVAA